MLGLIAFSTVAVAVVVIIFSALLWAAVQDGRDDRRLRRTLPRVDAIDMRPARPRPARPMMKARAFTNWTI